MTFAVYLPEKSLTQKCPVVYYLSGLTCNEQNVITKSGMQRAASRLGLIVVCPDTSPRGEGVPDKPDEYDMGMGAEFYVDATEEPWKKNFRMYSYITDELPALIDAHFPVLPGKRGIFGHSMGGHGALVIGLRESATFISVSALAPICEPSQCDWGRKALSQYLGPQATGSEAWSRYDAVELIRSGLRPACCKHRPFLVDQGEADNFLPAGQLRPEVLKAVCADKGVPLELRMQPGYDHSYFFIATFMDDHLEFHAANLLEKAGENESYWTLPGMGVND